MRLARCALMLLLCVCLLTTVVFADSTITNASSVSYITSNGACQVSLNVTIRLEDAGATPKFALPANAKNVTLNGASVRTYASTVSGDVIMADLSSLKGLVGDYPLTFTYTLNDVTVTENRKLYIKIPLLSGADYPIQAMSFQVTLPGEITHKPSFSSGYLQTGVESIISYVSGGSMLNGSVTQALSDQETLTMKLQVEPEDFPGKLYIEREGNPEVIYMVLCGAAAVIYWLLMLRNVPLIRRRETLPPEGITAGEMGCRLTVAGVDLTMMIFSWAKRGYVRIIPDRHGRVMIVKKMEMGNERTEFENRCFQMLFGRADAIDATGVPYAKLYNKVVQTVSGAKELHRRKAGNTRLFRVIGTGVSGFCGVCFAMNMIHRPGLQIFAAAVLAALGVVVGWCIQSAMYRIHLRGKMRLYLGIGCAYLWLILGFISGVFGIGLIVVLAEMLLGLMVAYGGRRSDLGLYQAGQILGLRRYLKTISEDDIDRNLENNPDYFFDMMPFALALGVEKRFAKRFGKRNVGHCTYMAARQDRRRDAVEWALLLRKTADRMDHRQRKMLLHKWFPFMNFI